MFPKYTEILKGSVAKQKIKDLLKKLIIKKSEALQYQTKIHPFRDSQNLSF